MPLCIEQHKTSSSKVQWSRYNDRRCSTANRSNALVGDGRCRFLTTMAKQRPERHFQVAEGDWL